MVTSWRSHFRVQSPPTFQPTIVPTERIISQKSGPGSSSDHSKSVSFVPQPSNAPTIQNQSTRSEAEGSSEPDDLAAALLSDNFNNQVRFGMDADKPLVVGSQMMIVGIPGEPGEAGQVGTVIQNLPDGRVALKVGQKAYIKTKRDNLVGRENVASILGSSGGLTKKATTFKIREQVMLRGLLGDSALNGRLGIVEGIQEDRNRVSVRISAGTVVNIKPENLVSKGVLGRLLRKESNPPDNEKVATHQAIRRWRISVFHGILFLFILTCFFSSFLHPKSDDFYIEFVSEN